MPNAHLSLALVLLLTTLAESAPAHLGTAPDNVCQLARDPARCAARSKARSACRDGGAGHRCQRAQLPAPDCSRANNPANCAAQLAARAACKEEPGAAFRRCMKRQFPNWRNWN